MSLLDIFKLLGELIRRGADDIAAFAVGLVVGPVLLWYLSPWFRKRQRRDQAQIDKLRSTVDALTHALEESADAKTEGEETNRTLQERLESQKEALADSNAEVSSLNEQVKGLTDQLQTFANFDGKLWERPVLAPIHRFRSLAERKTPIISIANLKGGVGKTTLTANLGAALWANGYRVLLVDLDYQGSLTSLCLSGQEIGDLRRRGRFIESLFLHEGHPNAVPALDYSIRIQNSEGFLIPAREELADVEMQVMAQWFLGNHDGDARYILRQALHSQAVSEQFDIVLLDCPPRLTTACINALAASDFVLVPVLLDLTSAEAVPRLLKSLRNLRTTVCPDLAVLGILGNRAYPRQELIAREQQIWNDLPAKCREAWGAAVHHFETVIRQNAEFATAAANQQFAALSTGLRPAFLDLISELQQRMPLYENRRPSVLL